MMEGQSLEGKCILGLFCGLNEKDACGGCASYCLRRLCIIHCFGCITCVEEDACLPLLWLHRFSSLSLSQPPPHLLLFYRHRILLHSAPFPFLPPPPMAAPNGVRFRCFVPEGHTGGDFLYVNFCLLFFFNRILYCTRTPHGRRLSFL